MEHQGSSLGDHQAPFRGPWRSTKSNETESCCSEEDRPEVKGDFDEQRCKGIREDMAKQDAGVACADATSRFDLLLFADREDLASYQTRITRPPSDDECLHDMVNASAQCSSDSQGKNEVRD